MMNVDLLILELNEPSRALAEELFRRFPAWIDFAEVIGRSAPHSLTGPGDLLVEIPSPMAGRNHSLQVMAQGDTFLTFYTYSDPRRPWEGTFIYAPGEEREAAIEAVDWVADIVEERVVLIEVRVGFLPWSRATGWWPIRQDELTEWRKRGVFSVSSWCGTFDEPRRARDGAG
jgi:hypothetical protein